SNMLLDFLTFTIQEEIINRNELFTLTNKRINPSELRKELYTIRSNLYAYSIDEQDNDTTGISFPIFNYENQIVAALVISGLSSRFQGEKLNYIKQGGKRTANTMSKQIGQKDGKKGQ